MGQNGAGKSTLVKLLGGLLQPDAGTLVWQGTSVTATSPAAARALGIALVFQHFSLFDSLTVAENLWLGLDWPGGRRALEQRLSQVSRHYGLALDPARPVHTLSTGERQRVEIVRCLLQQPRLLIMDEPTRGIDVGAKAEIHQLMRRLAGEGMAILMITHNLAVVAESAREFGADEQTDRVALLDFEGEAFAIGFTLLRYGDGWKVSSQASVLSGLPTWGAAQPMSAKIARPASMRAASAALGGRFTRARVTCVRASAAGRNVTSPPATVYWPPPYSWTRLRTLKPGGVTSTQDPSAPGRTIAIRPEIILMDEPASALDPIATAKIEDLIFQLKSSCTIVIVTHNMQQAARVADYTGFFLLGRLIEFDDTAVIFKNPAKKETEDYVTGRFG